ncbi:MAG: DUF2497 domain-containing protein [Alphaproteobacteria bacterium]|nr:DUF2497 domain-containing protein [Alphaproteobacteria bacterium]
MDFASAGRADADAEDALALSLDQVVDDSAEADDETSADRDYALPDDVAFVASDHIDLDVAPPSLRRNDDRSQFGAMPDMALSADLADHLLDSTTQVAAREAFSRLGGMAIGGGGQTVEGVVREMLRPMLKSWLDENLPSIVERLVEREIERVSRGGR